MAADHAALAARIDGALKARLRLKGLNAAPLFPPYKCSALDKDGDGAVAMMSATKWKNNKPLKLENGTTLQTVRASLEDFVAAAKAKRFTACEEWFAKVWTQDDASVVAFTLKNGSWSPVVQQMATALLTTFQSTKLSHAAALGLVPDLGTLSATEGLVQTDERKQLAAFVAAWVALDAAVERRLPNAVGGTAGGVVVAHLVGSTTRL